VCETAKNSSKLQYKVAVYGVNDKTLVDNYRTIPKTCVHDIASKLGISISLNLGNNAMILLEINC
jgi:hypothetical protein